MAVAPDLNHDGYSDLLVGAPLEDDHQGALYIYHGDEFYIIPQYKQVNMKSSFPKRYKSILIVFMKMIFFYLDPYILLIFNLSC